MSATTGICEYVVYSASGATVQSEFGIVQGGGFNLASAPIHVTGVGGLDELVGGMIEPTGSVEFAIIDVAGFIATYGRRDTGTTGYPCTLPTAFDIYLGLGGTEIKGNTCYVDTLTIDATVDDELKASVEFFATSWEEGSYAAPTLSGGTPHHWYLATAQFGTTAGVADAEVKSWSINISNNLEHYTTMDAKDVGSKRFPVGTVAGNEVVTLSMTTVAPLDSAVLDTMADDIAQDLKFVGTGSDGTNTITITLTGDATTISGLVASSAEQPIQVDGILEYTYEFELAFNRDTDGLTIIVS